MPASCSSCEDWCINGKSVSPYLDTSMFYDCIDRFHFIIIWDRCKKPGNMWQQHWLCASEANHVPTYHFIFSRFQFPLHFDLQNNHLSTCKMRIKHDTTCQASLTFSVWRTCLQPSGTPAQIDSTHVHNPFYVQLDRLGLSLMPGVLQQAVWGGRGRTETTSI